LYTYSCSPIVLFDMTVLEQITPNQEFKFSYIYILT